MADNNDLQAKLAAAREQLAEVQRQRAEEQRQWAEERAEEQRQRAEEQAISGGTFYALIDDVFQGSVRDFQSFSRDINKATYRNVCRLPNTTSQEFRNGEGRVRAYEITADTEGTRKHVADRTGQSRTGTHASRKDSIWEAGLTTDDAKAEIAHLVPVSVAAADTYWFVTDFLFGYNAERMWDDRRRLIHGANVDRKASSSRAPNTGIKHCVANKVVLATQKDYFDISPNVVLIPICDCEFAKNWNGEAYDAIMLIDANPPINEPGIRRIDALERSRRGYLAYIASLTLFSLGSRAIASPQEVRCAHNAGHFFDTTLRTLRGQQVRKVSFAAHETDNGHPAPDPILLVTRAADQLQKLHGISLVAAGEREDEDQDVLSVLAEEMYLLAAKRRREQAILGMDIEF